MSYASLRGYTSLSPRHTTYTYTYTNTLLYWYHHTLECAQTWNTVLAGILWPKYRKVHYLLDGRDPKAVFYSQLKADIDCRVSFIVGHQHAW